MAYESNSIFWIEVEKVVPNPFQPRREFNEDKLKELSESIKMYGVLQPLVVTRREIMTENGAFTTEYELIAGERRLRASKLAGLAQVPVIIRSGEETELMKLELAIIENLQREDLNAVDRALAFKQLAEKFGLSHAQVAKKVGRSREYVSNSIRLLGLPDTILNALRVGDISDGHARTLLMLNDRPEEQDVVFRETLLKKLSVREVERISRKIATDKVRKKKWDDSDPELIEIEKEFTETFGTRVQIQKTDFGGKLTIDYFEPGDLRRLLDLVHNAESSELGHTDTKILSQVVKSTPLEESVPEEVVSEEPESPRLSHEPQTASEPESKPYSVPEINGSLANEPEQTNINTEQSEAPRPSFEDHISQDTIPPVPPTQESGSPNVTETKQVSEVDAQTQPQESIATSATEVTQEHEPETKKDDSDLYSLRNFSL